MQATSVERALSLKNAVRRIDEWRHAQGMAGHHKLAHGHTMRPNTMHTCGSSSRGVRRSTGCGTLRRRDYRTCFFKKKPPET